MSSYELKRLENLEVAYSASAVWGRRILILFSLVLMAQPILVMNQFHIGDTIHWNSLDLLNVESVVVIYLAVGMVCILMSVAELRLMWKHKTTSVADMFGGGCLEYFSGRGVMYRKACQQMVFHFTMIVFTDVLVPILLMVMTAVYWCSYMLG